MSQPLLVSQAVADAFVRKFGRMPEGLAVAPPLKTSWPFECIWLRALGDFAHVHPVAQPCPYRVGMR